MFQITHQVLFCRLADIAETLRKNDIGIIYSFSTLFSEKVIFPEKVIFHTNTVRIKGQEMLLFL